MGTSASAYVLGAPSRKKSSRKILPQHFLGSAAVAGLVLGCAWTVYANIFAASVYPSVGNASFDAPVGQAAGRRRRTAGSGVQRGVRVADAAPAAPAKELRLPSPKLQKSEVATSEALAPSLMFNDRFAAASPEGVASSVVADAAPQIDPIKQAAAPKVVAKREGGGRPRSSPKHRSRCQRRNRSRPPRSKPPPICRWRSTILSRRRSAQGR